ncbi:MAG TPA: ATP-binding cassette domain-containing protein [Myxococcota bacterium]|nr:ATP-binding cassette domain-containing protein [Myxococcota bacterium]HRY96737.1 ATP-binding cassette domain-containing protein [Myxococcota bacterium]
MHIDLVSNNRVSEDRPRKSISPEPLLLGWGLHRVVVGIDEESERSLVDGIGYGIVWALIARRGLLLHASCGLKDGLAYVFVGPSGAGKSTILRNASGLARVNDDRIAVRSIRQSVEVFSVPQFDNAGRTGNQNGGRLGGLFVLEKGGFARIDRMSLDAAVGALALQTVLPEVFASQRSVALATILHWIGLGRVFRLQFRRLDDVTKLVEEVGHG